MSRYGTRDEVRDRVRVRMPVVVVRLPGALSIVISPAPDPAPALEQRDDEPKEAAT